MPLTQVLEPSCLNVRVTPLSSILVPITQENSMLPKGTMMLGIENLLAMKAAFEEWRHWLEGDKLPFIVLTDHRNLEYIRSAKRLNPRQARWSLFFSRFDFHVTYRPGSKNGKADALSRQFDFATSPKVPNEPVIPASLILAPVQWNIISEITDAQANDPTPLDCPPNLTYVPADL